VKCISIKKTQVSPLLSAPVEAMKNAFGSETALHRSVALSFVIPSEAEGSAVPRTFPGKADLGAQQNCHLDRSVAQWRDLRFLLVLTRL
jgi:hypothetical protein